MNPAQPLLRLALALALLTTVALAGCSIGGGDDKTASTTATVATTATTPTPAPVPKLVQRARAVNPKAKRGAKPTTFKTGPVQVSPGSTLLLVVSPPETAAGKRMTISIPDMQGSALTATTTVAGQQKTTQIQGRDGGAIKLLDVRYSCSLPPATFCPVEAGRGDGGGVRLRTRARRTPVFLQIQTGRVGDTLKQVRLLPTSLPAPGSPIAATVTVRQLRKGASPTPSTEATVSPGDPLQVIIRPAPGSPARGSLRIGIPRTSGKSISIRVGGTAEKPSNTATLTAKSGSIRVENANWGCRLPPATFCPIDNVLRTDKGVVLKLQTPRVPVILSLKIADA